MPLNTLHFIIKLDRFHRRGAIQSDIDTSNPKIVEVKPVIKVLAINPLSDGLKCQVLQLPAWQARACHDMATRGLASPNSI